jgi:excinuclease ABC subunit C
MAIQEKIKSAPEEAGVYLMKDNKGRVIYVGKAKSLKKRLMAYLGRDLSTKTVALMSHVFDIEYQVCPNESLSLLHEASLIHKYKPRYNVSLRDDKSFPSVKITNEEFPAIYVSRKKEEDGACYLGPYTNAKLLKSALKIIRRSFPYRSCKKFPKRPCIYYRLSLCPAPCIGRITKKEYAKAIRNISLMLDGKTDALIKRLTEDMGFYSKERKFEEAAKIRDQINALSAITQSKSNFSSQDVIEDLKGLLRLSRLPERIEAFDISNIKGQEATGSMVSFYKGVADKDNYRRFRIRTAEIVDDYKMLAEVIRRRYSRAIKERLALPDLILIDGGKGHLLTAQKELEILGLEIALASIAKEEENIYIKDNARPIKLKSDTPALNLIRKVRDEAHRFAIKYHHLLRRKKIIGK